MSIAVLSDIHGHLNRLQQVLDDADGCRRIICLGDLVEGGDDNDDVVALMRARADVCLRGNHDEEHDCVLSDESESFLAACPTEVRDGDVCFMHESPAAPPGKVTNGIEAWRALESCDARCLVVGDAHVAGLYIHDERLVGRARRVPFTPGERLALPPRRLVVCPGAVGPSRDGTASPMYAVVSDDMSEIEFRAPGR